MTLQLISSELSSTLKPNIKWNGMDVAGIL